MSISKDAEVRFIASQLAALTDSIVGQPLVTVTVDELERIGLKARTA